MSPMEVTRLEDEGGVRESAVAVERQSARVFAGGRGEPMVLVHGGWGGAATHWGVVWDRLAERFRIIAPDLPGLGRMDRGALPSVGDYARWLCALLDALDVPVAWCVGNSFGASVVCRFASDYPDRCRGLVLVNGFPMPVTPPLLRWLGERGLGHRLLRRMERWAAYCPSALERGFSDPSRAPEEVRRLVHAASPPQLDAMVNILVQGGSAAPARVAPFLLWGEDDHLPGTSRQAANKLHASWPGSTLVFVPGAGHLPQVENPAVFAKELITYVDAHSPPPGSRQ